MYEIPCEIYLLCFQIIWCISSHAILNISWAVLKAADKAGAVSFGGSTSTKEELCVKFLKPIFVQN